VVVLVGSSLVSDGPARAGTDDGALAAQHLRPGEAPDSVLAALADGRLVRNVPAPPPGSVTVSSVPVGFALTGDQLAPLDVSATPEAAQEIDAFVSRLRSRGIETNGTGWTVYALPSIDGLPVTSETDGDGPMSSVLIVPTGTRVDLVGAVFEAGQLHAKTAVTTTSGGRAPQDGRMHAMSASDSATFTRDGGLGCLERKQNNTAWYDPCQEFYVLDNDGDLARGYWASEMRGTGKGKSLWTLNSLQVSSRRADGTPQQEWVDWDPGADAEFGCRPQTVTVGYAGASVDITQQHCEVWDINKGEEAADFANWWRGHQRRKERETAAMTLTKLHNGDLPTLSLSFDYYANP
jgi:hypothetical protein